MFGPRASSTKYDAADTYDGVNLQQSLNLVTTSFGASVKNELTPLTTVSLVVSRSQDRFEFSPSRDSNSTAVSGTVDFDPYALIKGSATVGYRDFQPLSAGLADYKGVVATADLTYTLLGSTKFEFNVLRDVEYSYDVTQPYYIETGFDLSISQQIYGPLDLIVRGGLHQLAYRDQAGAVVEVANRVDDVNSYGGGLGYHFGDSSRLGFNVDRIYRDSDEPGHRYNDLRFGTSFTYGF